MFSLKQDDEEIGRRGEVDQLIAGPEKGLWVAEEPEKR
jgi:hypothetical protein